ncbi:MAG: hypothetical protein ABS36_18255 [Acidobacteria bacterium SCN 69-37]|nr:MAG: hypothetical protein ABS36_18255 [Acidobacteria bacterium SCN 69-37]
MRPLTPTLPLAAVVSTLVLTLACSETPRPQSATRLSLDFEDYAAMPITGELGGENTRGQLARVNDLRDEPGGRRFFVNDLNGPLYILDKQAKQFATYLDFNGLEGRPGLFPKFTFERNFATGLTSFVFDPDYANNGIFYTLHMEDPSAPAPAAPRAGVVPGLDVSGYQLSTPIAVPTADGQIAREVVLIEWTDRDTTNTTFEGTARELMRLQHVLPQHPLGEMTFNPVARPGDADWRVMYLGVGDAGSGDRGEGIFQLTPQRLDSLPGKILRVIPDLSAHTSTSTISENGRYRIPDDNPFAGVEGARKEIWAYGLRNPHRLVWDVDPVRPSEPRLLAFHIGLVTAETIVVIHKGANYGWPLREGTRALSPAGAEPLPANDTIPVRISDTVTRGTIAPTYPVAQYSHDRATGGDGIANGFVYAGRDLPALSNKLIFGDITTGRIWYADIADIRAADNGRPDTLAPLHEVTTDLRPLVEAAYRARGGQGDTLPGIGAVSGRGRVDVRFAVDDAGEIYLLTKSDGMIRKVVGAREVDVAASVMPSSDADDPSTAAATTPTSAPGTNPVPSTPASIASGKSIYDLNCAVCHGPQGEGAVRAGTTISIIEESGGRQPSDLTDAQWDHGATDGAIFSVIKRGVPPTMMAGYDGRIADLDIWHVVNYIRSLAR